MLHIRSEAVQTAVRSFQRRAERVLDLDKLHEIYVDSGVLGELAVHSNQVIHGRRGVGKTHLLHFFRQSLLRASPSTLFQIHDCQRLGSGYASDDSDARSVAISVFTQLLNDIATQAFDDLDRINARDSSARVRDPSEAVLAFQDVVTQGASASGKFNYRMLGDTLDAIRVAAGADFLVFGLDEFISIRRDAQPLVAEYLKRAFFTKPRLSFKLVAVTYLSRTSTIADGNIVGLEPGADTFSDVDMDKYFVWEEDDERAERFFGQVLYNHLAADLSLPLGAPPDLKRSQIVQTFFTQEKAFSEVCRAAEGNCRDLLNVFRSAYTAFLKDGAADRMGVNHVKKGAEEWFRTEKILSISQEPHLEKFLNYLIQHVIRDRRTKTMMIHYSDVNHPVLVRLFTSRLLHPLRTVWKHPDKPGEPYHLVTMDYGCYVALKNTKSAPEERLFFTLDDVSFDDLVPLDDRRSIRRVVVDREDLDRFLPIIL